jgi:Tol biopolymer transport system component
MHRFARRVSPALFAALLGALLGTATPAAAAEKYTRGLRYPCLTPDHEAVVFCYRGDIWVADVDGERPARRLTIHEAQDTLPRVSPDGKTVAFSSQRNGAYDIFLVPIEGGEARQLTFHSGVEIVCDWSPDGKRLLFVSNRDASRYRLNVYEVAVSGGTPRQITKDGGRDATYTPDGKGIVYARGFNTIYQDDYEGSANYDLHHVGIEGGVPKRLTKSHGNERYPFVGADGKTLYFVAEEDKVANFYATTLAGGERRQVTHLEKTDVHRPDLDYDGKTVVYERWGQLFLTDLTAAEPQAKPIQLVVRGDVRHSGVAQRTVTAGAEQVDVSKDGSRLVFSLHGDIWLTAGSGGNARRLTSGPAVDEWPRFRPDGAKVAFQSDRSGNSDIFLLDVASGAISQVTKDKSGDFYHNWSPDGRKLVFCSERSGNRDIWTIDVESQEAQRLTTHSAADDDPVFSPNGRSIAFDSGREGTQAIFIMDANGSNVRRVTGASNAYYQVPSFSPDSSLIVYEIFNPASGRSGGLHVTAATGGESMQISSDGSTACWSPRGDFIYFSAGTSGSQEIFRVPAPRTVENREKVPFIGTVEVDLRKELADLFEEAWRRLRDGFYDPKMHGVDWDAMKKKYRDMAVDAENKVEFQNVVMQMLAELNASHLGIHGGRKRSNTVSARVVPTGYLGVEFADRPLEDGGRKIELVFPGGPADRADLRVGDVILAVERKRIRPDTDLDQVLRGTVGKEIRVRYRPFTEEGHGTPREKRVKPISAGQLARMRHARWVAGNLVKVRKETKGKVAYIHLNAMNAENLARFRRAIANWNLRQRSKRGGPEGLIIDVRENGGGNIHQQLMEVLTARPFAQIQVRGSRIKMTQPTLYWDRPVVVLINERSFSDAEVFPYVFQHAGVGKVIGVPTPGGVIGTNDVTLSDGTTFRIPRVGYYGMDGTNLERLGVKPDILVEETAEDRLAGRDPQLARAIEVVMEQVEAAGGGGASPAKPPATKPPATEPPVDEPDPREPTPPPAPAPDEPDAGSASAMDPLADAKVGEWVRYEARLPGAQEPSVLKLRVVEVQGGTVYFDKEFESGPPAPLPLPADAPQVPLLEGLASMGRVLGQETRIADVDGERAEVAIITLEAYGGQLRMYFTNAVPALGLWKVEIGKLPVFTARAWGRDEPREPAPAGAAAGREAPLARPERAPRPEPGAPVEPSEAVDAPTDPLGDASPGEWIRFRSIVQGKETIATLRVTEVTEDSVQLDSRVAYDGTEHRGAPLSRPRRPHLPVGGRGRTRVEVGRETLHVKGHALDCVTITRTSRRGRVDKRWICADVPVSGLVRQERDGELVKELLDWGSHGEPPALPAAGR